ncbi:MAG: hypothetical protein HRU21_09915 [Pseudomonadales bacterium]|nr:hypothetical protein [Pseudomonadales bacterium]
MSLSERLLYYVELIIQACGYNGSEGNAVLGWFIVSIAALIVIAAYYYCISLSLWPGEQDQQHIKRRILMIDSEVYHEN